MPQDLLPKTWSGASSPGWPPTGTSAHKRSFTSFSATISSTHDTCSEITTRLMTMTMTLPLRHPSRPATQGNLSAVTVLNLLQKCVVHFCSEFNTVTGASAPPLLPSSSCSFVNRAHPSSKSWPRLCRAHRKHVAVRAWPRVNAFPDCSLAHFDVQAPLSQLRLHKSLRVVKELSTPDVGQVLYDHLKTGGFHHLRRAQQDIDTDSEPRQRRHSSLLSNPPRDRGRLAVTTDPLPHLYLP